MSESVNSTPKNPLSKQKNIFSFALVSAVFYLMAYYSVSDFLPNAIPVHHDDYTNYASAAGGFAWSWIRPVSTWLIFVFSSFGPDWLIWAVRIFTATYVFLCWKILIEVLQPRHYLITLILFATATMSTPIVAEYARYTGMLTHMVSGCFGLSAVYFLFKDDREDNDIWLYVSVMLLLLSALAKEDFILFYALSFAYTLFKSKKSIKKRILIGLTGLSMSLFMIAGSKFLAASSFLGVNDTQSPYFIDISATSVVTTVWHYLIGAGHPAMKGHGIIIAAAMVFSGIVALSVMLRDRKIPKTFYFFGAALTLIAPYSVLPNHVNAYYELIWLPFIIGSVYVALAEAMNTRTVLPRVTYLACVFFSAISIALNIVDKPGRTSIAQWYDAIGSANTEVFKILEGSKVVINASPSVCIYGANAFSPWYMHNGQYLNTVMGLHTVWNIVIDKSSSLSPGFQLGANSSEGRVVLLDYTEANETCLKLSIAGG